MTSDPTQPTNSTHWPDDGPGRLAPFVAILLGCALVVYGWKLLWFLTDDAFISFRYASNWVEGIGPTWNPPPFAHVEGYSNFLWMALLAAVWKVTGAEPPQVANLMLLAFGLGTVALTGWWLAQIVSRGTRNHHIANAHLLLALLLICTNKSFLTWLSSGLETSLFTFLIVCWAYAMSGPRTPHLGVPSAWATWTASLAALTRPDGLLYWALTAGAWAVLSLLGKARPLRKGRGSLSLAGLAVVPLHLLWRRYYYSAWLPNTYYAKVGAPWPLMGLRYLLSYVIEYALFIPVAFVAWYGIRRLREMAPSRIHLGGFLVLVGALLQVAYYTLIVGGDHFEYRVFHHLVPLTVIGVCAAATQLASRPWVTTSVLLAWLGMQSVIPWADWSISKDLYTRDEAYRLYRPISSTVPVVFRPLTIPWEHMRQTMVAHSVGLRHQEHKVFYLYQRALYPARSDMDAMSWQDRNVIAVGTVGVPGWVYSHAAVIDMFGLNDRALAKSASSLRPQYRQMAHDVVASARYVACYAPNLRSDLEPQRYYGFVYRHLSPDVKAGEFGVRPVVEKRSEPLTDDQVRRCETYPWTKDMLYKDAGIAR